MDKDIARFESLLLSTKREGIETLLDFLRQSDFYTAPASTKYHSCHAGGLLEHSLNVNECLLRKFEDHLWKEKLAGVSKESASLCSLLHDFSKNRFYEVEYKNKKIYSETGKKIDSNGRFDWVTVPGYAVNDTHPLGHAEGSVIMLQQFIRLKPVELYAIRWHHCFAEPKDNYNTLSSAIRKYPLILALHEADMEATYLLEEEE